MKYYDTSIEFEGNEELMLLFALIVKLPIL